MLSKKSWKYIALTLWCGKVLRCYTFTVHPKNGFYEVEKILDARLAKAVSMLMLLGNIIFMLGYGIGGFVFNEDTNTSVILVGMMSLSQFLICVQAWHLDFFMELPLMFSTVLKFNKELRKSSLPDSVVL